MRDLDDTDREILRLLFEDARRPFSDIADRVGLSAPAVSDRVDRLREMGVIEGFTLDVDRSLLDRGVRVLVELDVSPPDTGRVVDGVEGLDAVDHVFETADGDVVFEAGVPPGNVRGLLDDAVDFGVVRDVRVRLLAGSAWSPGVGDATLSPTCAECGNTVTAEGESERFDDEVRYFCCSNCLGEYRDRYEELKSGV